MMFVVLMIWMHMQYQEVSAQNFCGDILANATGWFASPDTDMDGEYDFNYRCTWVVMVPHNKIILIQFHEFDVEESLKCQYDYLTIRDGNTKAGHYCGKTLPPDFVSSARLVFIDFNSDSFINRKGFNATYTEMDDVNCGYTTWSIAGRFGSSDTDIEFDCLWTIKELKHVPAIQIYIAELNIEWTEGCDLYFLEVSNMNETLGVFCGTPPPIPLTSVSNELFLHLRSSGNVKFDVYYSTTDVNGTYGGILPNSSGIFTATDYDHNGMYDHNVNTVWAIVAPRFLVIRLDIKDIHIYSSFDSCDGDSLKIYDGILEVGEESKEICGYFSPDFKMVSYNRVVFVHFVTNGYYSGQGFNASYKHVTGRIYTGAPFTGALTYTSPTNIMSALTSELSTSILSTMSTTAARTVTEYTGTSAATVIEISATLEFLLMMTLAEHFVVI